MKKINLGQKEIIHFVGIGGIGMSGLAQVMKKMGFKILHNPRCSKSRQTLAILSDNGIDVDIIEYLKDVPSEKTLRQIIDILGIKPRELLRKGEVVYKENNLRREDLTDDDLIQFMLDNPILIERPIVYDDKRAVIGRPPDNVLKLIK